MSIKTSADFENDPEGAMDALDKTGVAIFMISVKWFDDQRALKEWRYAKEINKPMIYILEEPAKLLKKHNLRFLMEYPHLIATINYYGNMKETGEYIQAIMAAFCHTKGIIL